MTRPDLRAGPQRTCVGCGRRAPQAELTRFTRISSEVVREGRDLPGRGAWLCAGSLTCAVTARRRRALDRAFRAPVGPRVYDGICEAWESIRSGSDLTP